MNFILRKSLIPIGLALSMSSCLVVDLKTPSSDEPVTITVASDASYTCDSDAVISYSHEEGVFDSDISLTLDSNDDNCTILYCVASASSCGSPCTTWTIYVEGSTTISVADGEEYCINATVSTTSPTMTAGNDSTAKWYKVNSSIPNLANLDFKRQFQSRGYTDISFSSSDVPGAGTVETLFDESASTSPYPAQGTTLLAVNQTLGHDMESTASATGPPSISTDIAAAGTTADPHVIIRVEGADIDQSWFQMGETSDLHLFVYDYSGGAGNQNDDNYYARRTINLKVYDFEVYSFTSSNHISTSIGSYKDLSASTAASPSFSNEGGFVASGFSHFDSTSSGSTSGTNYDVYNSAGLNSEKRVLTNGFNSIITFY